MTAVDGDAEGTEQSPTPSDPDALTGPIRSLDPRVRYVWVLQSLLGAAVLGAVAGVVAYLVSSDLYWIGIVAFVLAGTVTSGLAIARYRVWRYRVRSDSLFLDRGVVTRVRTVVPYVRIQHVDSNRGPVERAVGLATVVVYTAGSRGADVTIPGLTPEDAEELQERLKRLAIVAEGEDAV